MITEEGWTQAQVAEAAEVHLNTVSKWVKRVKAAGKAQSEEDAKDRRIRELETEKRALEKELAFSKKVAA